MLEPPLSRILTALLLLLAAAPLARAQVPFENPPSVSSVGGVLEYTLRAAPSQITVANKTVISTVYNDSYIVPVFRVQPGDTLQIHQVNDMPEWEMNFHTHGLTTTPAGNADNVFVVVDPNTSFDTEIPIPASHQSGMYWFHPHVHGFVNNTISNGMAGALIIGDILEPFPELAGITEQVMILKDLKVRKGVVVDDPDPSGKTLRTINGLYKPEIQIQYGELQFWRIGNMGANIYYQLELPGVVFHVMAIDGNLQTRITRTNQLVIPPGGRVEALVRGPRPGRYKLQARRFSTGKTGDQYPGQLMATLVSSGPQAEYIRYPEPSDFPPLVDLRDEAVDMQRTVVFDDTDDPDVFVIDDQVYDLDRVDQTVQLGALEEWTLQNASEELHVFHIHQGDFQVVSINGEIQPFIGYQDVVSLPVATRDGPGEVVMRMKFDPPIIVGEFVYHCHIVQHEDQGMMANVVVQDALMKLMLDAEPPDLIADALTPATGNYWCR